MSDDSKLKPCPCGETPKELVISDGYSCKFAYVSGDCCGDWDTEFHTGYTSGPALMERAVEAWNAARRAPELVVSDD